MNWRDARQSASLQFAVIGDPVDHSLSPKMQGAALRAMGQEGEYLALRVPESEFAECVLYLASIGFSGVNVTIPHKAAAANIGAGDAVVQELGVANTLKFSHDNIYARNTDVLGFFEPLAHRYLTQALVLGAGGAATACLYALVRNGISARIWNRSHEKAKELATRFGAEAVFDPDPSDCDLVVNATPLGLEPGTMPELQWQHISPNTVVYDMAYRDEPTDLLRRAAKAGCATIDGREMLVAQGAESMRWWLGMEPPVNIMRKAVGL